MRAGDTVSGFSTFGAEKRVIRRKIGIAEFAFTLQKPCPANLANIRSWRGRGAAFWTDTLVYGKAAL